MIKPNKPAGMNGDISHLWDFIGHLNERIDKLYIAIVGGSIAIVVSVVGAMLVLLLN